MGLLELISQSEIKSKAVGYYSVSVDSTPDMYRIDQLTVIVRYVSPSNGKASERFLTLLPIECHKGEYLADTLVNYLESKCLLDFKLCKGQSYDNAVNVTGSIMACNSVY